MWKWLPIFDLNKKIRNFDKNKFNYVNDIILLLFLEYFCYENFDDTIDVRDKIIYIKLKRIVIIISLEK